MTRLPKILTFSNHLNAVIALLGHLLRCTLKPPCKQCRERHLHEEHRETNQCTMEHHQPENKVMKGRMYLHPKIVYRKAIVRKIMSGPARNTCINSAACPIACMSEDIRLFILPTRDFPASAAMEDGVVESTLVDVDAVSPCSDDGVEEPETEGAAVDVVVLGLALLDVSDFPSATTRIRRACWRTSCVRMASKRTVTCVNRVWYCCMISVAEKGARKSWARFRYH